MDKVTVSEKRRVIQVVRKPSHTYEVDWNGDGVAVEEWWSSDRFLAIGGLHTEKVYKSSWGREFWT